MSGPPIVREVIIIDASKTKDTLLSNNLIEIDNLDACGRYTKDLDRSPLYPTYALIVGKWYKGYVPEVVALPDETFVIVFHKGN